MDDIMQDITTPRLLLRRFLATDAEDIYEYLAQPRVNCFLDGKVDSLEQAKAEALMRSQGDTYLAVCLKETGVVIGDLFLYKDDKHKKEGSNEELEKTSPRQDVDTYSVGWNFNGKFEGQGYAYESAIALFEYLFMQKNVRRIYAYVEDYNHRSQALCKKLGMRQEGCFIEFVSFVNYADGTPQYENTFQYAILKKEWLLRDK